MTTMTVPKPVDMRVIETIQERFTLNDADQWFYPTGASIDAALVRLTVYSGQYRVERRRLPHGPWMPVVAAATADFDAESFATWHTRWPLSV